MLSVRQKRRQMPKDGFSLEILINQYIDWKSLILLYIAHLVLLLCLISFAAMVGYNTKSDPEEHTWILRQDNQSS